VDQLGEGGELLFFLGSLYRGSGEDIGSRRGGRNEDKPGFFHGEISQGSGDPLRVFIFGSEACLDVYGLQTWETSTRAHKAHRYPRRNSTDGVE
jgi:hypothetical protein